MPRLRHLGEQTQSATNTQALSQTVYKDYRVLLYVDFQFLTGLHFRTLLQSLDPQALTIVHNITDSRRTVSFRAPLPLCRYLPCVRPGRQAITTQSARRRVRQHYTECEQATPALHAKRLGQKLHRVRLHLIHLSQNSHGGPVFFWFGSGEV